MHECPHVRHLVNTPFPFENPQRVANGAGADIEFVSHFTKRGQPDASSPIACQYTPAACFL